MYWIGQKVRIIADKFVEGFFLGLGIYGFYKFAGWMEWIPL